MKFHFSDSCLFVFPLCAEVPNESIMKLLLCAFASLVTQLNEQQAEVQKMVHNFSAVFRKSLSDGNCMSPLKRKRNAWDLFICSPYEIPSCSQMNREISV